MEELDAALLELDSISKFDNLENSMHNNDYDFNSDEEDDDDDDSTEHPNESNFSTVLVSNQADILENKNLKMQVKDYQRRLFQRTTMLEDLRKAYLRDVVILKNIMKVITDVTEHVPLFFTLIPQYRSHSVSLPFSWSCSICTKEMLRGSEREVMMLQYDAILPSFDMTQVSHSMHSFL